jgi:hypothetical protein
MSHRHVICDQGYDIERCRCPGPITAVRPCSPDHFHGALRWEPKAGDPVLIEDARNPKPEVIGVTSDAVRGALESVYGTGEMVATLAEVIVERWDDWEADEYRDLPRNLHLCIWDWFAGGDTASLAADRVMIAVGHNAGD